MFIISSKLIDMMNISLTDESFSYRCKAAY